MLNTTTKKNRILLCTLLILETLKENKVSLSDWKILCWEIDINNNTIISIDNVLQNTITYVDILSKYPTIQTIKKIGLYPIQNIN